MQERTRTLLLLEQYENYREQQVQRRLESEYSGEKLDQAIREQLKGLRRSQTEWFARAPESTRREVALSQLKQLVRERMNVMPFEDWLKKEAQLRMFT
jgi:hypothetical protein